MYTSEGGFQVVILVPGLSVGPSWNPRLFKDQHNDLAVCSLASNELIKSNPRPSFALDSNEKATGDPDPLTLRVRVSGDLSEGRCTTVVMCMVVL